jgi:hypothetical protein
MDVRLNDDLFERFGMIFTKLHQLCDNAIVLQYTILQYSIIGLHLVNLYLVDLLECKYNLLIGGI